MTWRTKLRRALGVPSPSQDLADAMRSVDWRATLQPPNADGTPWAGAIGVLGATTSREAHTMAAAAGLTVTPPDTITPDDTHSGEPNMEDDQHTNNIEPSTVWAANHHLAPHPDAVTAHVEREWETDTLRIILRAMIPGVGVVLACPQQIDHHPVSLDLWVEPVGPGQNWVGDQPGIRLRQTDAHRIAAAVFAELGDNPADRLRSLTDENAALAADLRELEKDLATETGWRSEQQTRADGLEQTLAAVERNLAWCEPLVEFALAQYAPKWVTGTLEETTETWTAGPGLLQVIQPEWTQIQSSELATLRQEREEYRVALRDVEAKLTRERARWEQTRQEGAAQVARLQADLEVRDESRRLRDLAATNDREQVELEAKVAGYKDAANDLTAHAVSWAKNGGDDLVELVNGIRSHAGLPTLAELPDPPEKRTPEGVTFHLSSTAVENPVENQSGERWHTVVGDTWEKRTGPTGNPYWFLIHSTSNRMREGAVYYIGPVAITPEDVDCVATEWANRPMGD